MNKYIWIIVLLITIDFVVAVDEATSLGILNLKTISYVGFSLLGVLLLVMVVYIILQLLAGNGQDLFSLIVGVISLGVIIILGIVIIYNVSNTNTNNTSSTINGQMMSMPLNLDSGQEIINIQICDDDIDPCTNVGLSSSNVTIYWEVLNGVGCCNTFGCDYELFKSFCGAPYQSDFKLYDIALNGVMYEWGSANSSEFDYDYTCTYSTPWNYFNYKLSPGFYTVTIWQKDCSSIVDIENVSFYISPMEDGTYDIYQT